MLALKIVVTKHFPSHNLKTVPIPPSLSNSTEVAVNFWPFKLNSIQHRHASITAVFKKLIRLNMKIKRLSITCSFEVTCIGCNCAWKSPTVMSVGYLLKLSRKEVDHQSCWKVIFWRFVKHRFVLIIGFEAFARLRAANKPTNIRMVPFRARSYLQRGIGLRSPECLSKTRPLKKMKNVWKCFASCCESEVESRVV